MKTKLGFLKHIRFTGSLAIILFIISVYLVCTSSVSNDISAYSSSNISKVEFAFLDASAEEAISIRNNIDYYDAATDLRFGQFDLLHEQGILVKATVEPIQEEGTYFIVNSNRKTKEYINMFLDDKELYPTHPQVVSYDENGQFNYYLLPLNNEETEVYIYFDKGYSSNGFSKPSFIVGTESELLLTEGYRSILDFIIAGTLFIIGIFIFMIFYITGIEKYNVVRLFGYSFFLIGIQYIVFSPFVTFAFNEFTSFFLCVKIITYMFLCIISYMIPFMYIYDRRLKYVFIFNIVGTGILAIYSVGSIIFGNHFNSNLLLYYNFYYMVTSILSLVLNLYNFEDESDAISIFRIIAYCGLITLNMFFYYYETSSSVNSIRNPYYFILLLFISFVTIYIATIFIYRNKSIKETKLFLYDEKETIERIYRSNKNAITTTNIDQISENILSDIKGIYPNYKFAMIIHRDLHKTITIPASTEFKGDLDRHAHKIFRKYYKRMPKSSFATYFNGESAVLLFRSSTGEVLLVYVKNDKTLTELDEMASEILASPILLSFNNCRIYDEISNTERELLLAIGQLTFDKSGSLGDIWRQGEFCYLLAKNTGLSEELAKSLRVGSYVADIGKVGMSDDLANFKNISPMEENLFYQHTEIGYKMLSEFSGETMKIGAKCALYHHEKYNGKGYLGKQAEEIPIEARIYSICSNFDEFFDELCRNKKDLRQSELLEESYSYLSMNKQTLFDPLLVQLFIKDKANIESIVEKSRIRNREIEAKNQAQDNKQ